MTLDRHKETTNVSIEIDLESQFLENHKYFLAVNRQSEIRFLIKSQKSCPNKENLSFVGSIDMKYEGEEEIKKYLNS